MRQAPLHRNARVVEWAPGAAEPLQPLRLALRQENARRRGRAQIHAHDSPVARRPGRHGLAKARNSSAGLGMQLIHE